MSREQVLLASTEMAYTAIRRVLVKDYGTMLLTCEESIHGNPRSRPIGETGTIPSLILLIN